MASKNRATLINKTLKVLKRHFKPAEINKDRTLFEHLLYACCLENSLHDDAEQVFELLTKDYFDWNEVRVSSIRELTAAMKPLNDPQESAVRLKRVLQSVFETHYSFDLEAMKKQNIGQTVKQLEKYNGTTSFTVAFVTQNALSGHSIPINRGLLESMRVVGVISDNEAAKGAVPGLERAVPKSKGIEVGSILHQLGVELHRSPYGPGIRKLLLEIAPDCKERLPKRPGKKPEKPAQQKPAAAKPKKAKAAPPKKSAAPAKKKKPAKPTRAKTSTKAAPKKKKVVKKKQAAKKTAKKKVVKKKSKAPAKTKKKSSSKKLTKRKPK
ncbi:MAG: hypothetical protein MI725_09840 [Pirellulales bacterium]|nr:hypothetical protein [Pirellulales bacterium]